MKGMFSFSQYCSNAVGELGPKAMTTALRLVNSSYSSRRRANCARQYGHINPRRKASTTGLPCNSDNRIRFPNTSSISKSGARSPGVINLLTYSKTPKIVQLIQWLGSTVPQQKWLQAYPQVVGHKNQTGHGYHPLS